MDEREIEAVARAICRAALNQEEEWRLYTIHARPAIAALDAVRDARGDDEVHLSDKARAMIVSRQIMGDDDDR